jgi:hypothetical protein
MERRGKLQDIGHQNPNQKNNCKIIRNPVTGSYYTIKSHSSKPRSRKEIKGLWEN